MFRAFPIGRLFGIRLDVHPSWFPIYALVAVTIANAGPIAVIGWAAAYGIGAAAALVLFASVVIHELAHALTARRFGVQTSSIALFLFGGVATLEEEPPSPLADALVALAGPATSAVIALAAWGAMHAVDGVVPVRYADAVASMLAYVTFANAVLATFNLIPGYPMDGGRVLRALLWRLRGDRDGATATAALVGIGFGLCFAAGGLVAVAVTRTWQFAWYVVVAGFLIRTSWGQYRALRRAPVVTLRPSLQPSEVSSVGVRTADRWSV
ncbi:MAG TPA: site-2 protease family protein [Candidatus Lustribacter sp.]|jgi:Zn-dependent protease|nr:site-2 protease family protein [Candidatus Lustribacter sp.]